MSRLTSDASGGVQVTRSANSIYTVLLICALVVIVATIIYSIGVTNNRFGYAFPLGEQYEKGQQDAKAFSESMDDHAAAIRDTLTSYDLGKRLDSVPAGAAAEGTP